jgi:hypothetical protein
MGLSKFYGKNRIIRVHIRSKYGIVILFLSKGPYYKEPQLSDFSDDEQGQSALKAE